MPRFMGRRGFGYRKPGLLTANHCLNNVSTTAATESLTTLFTGIDTTTNRASDIPTDAILTRVLVKAWATDTTVVQGSHQCFMFFRPGAVSLGSTPIASWFTTTEPMTEDAIDVRRYKMSRSPERIVTIAGASFAPRFTCHWKGKKIIHDGDDVIISNLDTNATNWLFECSAWYIR